MPNPARLPDQFDRYQRIEEGFFVIRMLHTSRSRKGNSAIQAPVVIRRSVPVCCILGLQIRGRDVTKNQKQNTKERKTLLCVVYVYWDSGKFHG